MQHIAKRDKGFTLIEVVIVIAIAAALIAIVLLAVGGAQKSRRDTTRANNVGKLAAQMEQYASNSGGNYPTSGMTGGYIANLKDPLSGSDPVYGTGTVNATTPVRYASSYQCARDGSGNIVSPGAFDSAGGDRNYAIVYWSETGNTTVCRDNK